MISDPDRLPEWNASVVRARRATPGPVGLGTRAVAEGQVVGQRVESETEVVVFDPPRVFATRALRGPRLNSRFQVEASPSGVGTLVRGEIEGDLPGGRLAEAVAGRVLRGDFDRSLDRLRQLCEREAAGFAGGE